MKLSQWHACYDAQWSGVITPHSFAHPAKYARGLIERIYRHCLQEGYLQRGDVVGDCFGGVGTGGIMAAYADLRWIGVELEPRFVAWTKENFGIHKRKLEWLGRPLPTIIQGDSRKFDELIQQAAGVISSPPYAAISPEKSSSSVNIEKQYETYRKSGGGMSLQGFTELQAKHSQGYGHSEGQISALPCGDVAAVVSSPPYADIAAGAGGLNTKPAKHPGQQSGRTPTLASQNADQRYGKSEGQISLESQETYWQAMRDVYAACFRAIKPDGIMVLVLKDYVKNRQRVPLADDTVMLCESLGFTLIERVQAMLVSQTEHADLFTGVDVKTKSRKSFFRRLAESKGSPKIDHEDVLFFRRPGH